MENKHLLIIRFSALGEVLMLVPVVEALAKRYPEVKITVVSRPKVESVDWSLAAIRACWGFGTCGVNS